MRNILVCIVIAVLATITITEANAAGGSIWTWERVIQTEAHQLTVDSADDVDIIVDGFLAVEGEDVTLHGSVCLDERCISVLENFTILSLSSNKQVAEVVDAHGIEMTAHILDRIPDSYAHMNVMLVDPAWGSTTTHSFHLAEYPAAVGLIGIGHGVSVMTAISELMRGRVE